MLALLQQILIAIIPVALIIFLGWFVGVKKIIANSHSESFATYVIHVSFPCSLFLLTATSKPSDLLDGPLVAALWLGIVGMFGLSFLIYKIFLRRSLKECMQGALVCSFADMAFMGIPIFTSLLGKQALLSIAIGNICTSLFIIPIVTMCLNSREDQHVRWTKSLAQAITKPLVLAPILGTLCALAHVPIPLIITNALSIMGASTSGVSLFALGLIMSRFSIRWSKLVGVNIGLKNILHPLLMLAIVSLCHIKGTFAKEAILLCAMPTASMATMFALKYNVLTEESTSATVLGTILSLLTLTCFMVLLDV